MQLTRKFLLLLALTVVTLIVVFLLPHWSQDLSFHNFADHREFGGIPNFANVMSNLPFLLIGAMGLGVVWKRPAPGVTPLRATAPRAIQWMYGVLFLGVILTGLGSAYYHSNPNNDTLVWDRIPMTIVFMSFLSATIAELINRSLGTRLLIPMLIIGVSSVLWWHYTEGIGQGDLRLYMWVQYYPMLVIPLIIGMYYDPAHRPALLCLVWVVIWYVVAKIFERLDYPIYNVLGVSGHTLKHLAAAMSTWYFVVLFRRKYF